MADMIKKLGIDFGTSFCSISALTPKGPEVIRIGGQDKMPTALFYEANGNVLIGNSAVNRFNNSRDINDYLRYITSVKSEIYDDLPIILPDNKLIRPVEAMAKIVSYLIELGEKYFNGPIEEVTLTCPASFEHNQFELYKEALELARVQNYTVTEDRTFLLEPVAAALAHFKEPQLKNGVLVYDLGGGTFDLAYVYRGADGLWSIPVKPIGLTNCAGDYFDRLIYKEAEKQLKTTFSKDKNGGQKFNPRILADCCKMKETLSSRSSDKRSLDGKSFSLSRKDFEDLIRDKLEATMKQTEVYLKDVQAANLNLENVSVLLIGGSTAIPLVKKMLDKTLKQFVTKSNDIEAKRLSSSDTAVAMGAAVYFPDVDNLQSLKEFDEKEILTQTDTTKMILETTKYCPNCGAPLFGDSGICYNCGEIYDKMLLPPQIRENAQIKEKIRKRIMTLRNALKKVTPPSSTMWSASSARYARAIKRIESALSSKDLKEYNYNVKSWNKVKKLCSNSEFHIAIVGTVKAGKSTLLNAILGHEGLATTSITPETASLTKFRASSTNLLSINISFYDEKEWDEIWRDVTDPSKSDRANIFLEEYNDLQADSVKKKWINHKPQEEKYDNIEDLKNGLIKWTSSKAKEHFFVKEVEVRLNNDNLPDSLKNVSTDIIFVDTPGLNDVVEYRSNITKEYIYNADVVLACNAKDNITEDAHKEIITVFNNSYSAERVYIIGTKIDGFDSPIQDWEEQKDYWVKTFKDKYGSEAVAQKRIVGISAQVASSLNNSYQNKQDNPYWFEDFLGLAKSLGCIKSYREGLDYPEKFEPNGEIFNKLVETANIDNLIDIIKTEFIKRYKYLLLQDIQHSFADCSKDLIKWANNWELLGMKTLNDSTKGLKTLKADQKERLAELDKLKNFKAELEDGFKELKSKIEAEILTPLKECLME